MNRSEAGKLGYEKCREALVGNCESIKQRSIARFLLAGKKCPECQVPLPYEKRRDKFCSQSCAARHHNFGRRKRAEVKYVCDFCREPLARPRGGIAYCSRICHNGHRQELLVRLWKQGKEAGFCGKTIQIKSFLRRYLFEKAGNKCQKCGWCEVHPTTGKIPLEVNHIDGNPENCSEDNLELICPNCHALTPNFRSLNRNSPRSRG